MFGIWRANEDVVPAFSYVLRAVLANAPNSIPPERVFSILDNSFDDGPGPLACRLHRAVLAAAIQ